MAINGPLECNGPYKIKAFKRFVIYSKIYEQFHLAKLSVPIPKQDGCYPMEGDEAPCFQLCQPIGIYARQTGMYHWCNDNCNSEHPNCPDNMCQCDSIVDNVALCNKTAKIEEMNLAKIMKINK